MATLTTYTQIVQDEVSDHGSQNQGVVEQAIKDTYDEILSYTVQYLVGSTEEDITATIDQRYVTPTTSFQEIDHVLWKEAGDDTFTELSRISEADYYRLYVNSDSSTPAYYYLKGGSVYFDVAPDNAGTVRVSGIEAQDELTGSTTSVIPDRFTRVVVLGSVARFKAFEGVPEAAEYQKMFKGSFWGQGRIDGALGDMIRELSRKQKTARPKLYGR